MEFNETLFLYFVAYFCLGLQAIIHVSILVVTLRARKKANSVAAPEDAKFLKSSSAGVEDASIQRAHRIHMNTLEASLPSLPSLFHLQSSISSVPPADASRPTPSSSLP